ncbi:MAG: peptidase M61 [Gammaproteobacteria bacterium]|nr:MAG: peptidase M61 [Gammaproteobacteria bacterium]
MIKFLKLPAIFSTLFTVCSLVNSAQANVIADITISDPVHHLAQVNLTFEPSKKNTLEFKLPTWRTGRYEILKLANGIRDFSVIDQSGNKVPWHKTDKSTWQVNNVIGKQLSLSYQLYANQLGKRTRHIDDSHAYLDASAVFMYTPSQRDAGYTVNLSVPKTWRSVSGLKQGKNKQQFLAENYDVLVDSPIETGIHKSVSFNVDGRDYQVIIWGEGNYDLEQIRQDLKILVKQPSKIWHDYPFSRYVFMVHATSGERGATEHVNSTIIQRSRYAFSSRKDYLGFLSTAAHEFVHTWNVKQYRPQGLYPYDYQQENYTSLLWLSEGSTSYLQSQLLMRGELMTSSEYLKELAKRITGYLHKPGRESQTVAQASFDNWISEGGDYGQNNSVNIYSEGFLVSWLLDFDLLSRTKLQKSYRDVHHLLYKNYRLPHAFSEDDVQSVLEQLTQHNYSQWWQANVHNYPQVDFNRLLAKAGLTMGYGDEEKVKTWSGIKTKVHKNGLEIIGIEKNSPAWQAQLALNDIIIAVDGLRINEKDLKKRLANFQSQDQIKITLFRRDQLMTKKITLAELPKEKLTIKPLEDVTKKQKSFFKAWTGLTFPESSDNVQR